MSVRKRRLTLPGSWGGLHIGVAYRDGVGLRDLIRGTEAPRDLPRAELSLPLYLKAKVAGAPLELELEERSHWQEL